MRTFPLSESALTIELGNDISPELNLRAIAVAKHVNDSPFPGLIEAVPAYASVTVFYDLETAKGALPESKTVFSAVGKVMKQAAESMPLATDTNQRLIEIPMTASSDASPDLDAISESSGLAPDEVLDIFLARTYRVYMLGFLPGFAYLGELDERIATPRLATPRTRVPKGSIGIAGKQTGIYPLDSPGGWNIIGRTDLAMFDPNRADLCPLRPGDKVRFKRG